jgi:hypothetical protein
MPQLIQEVPRDSAPIINEDLDNEIFSLEEIENIKKIDDDVIVD